MKGKKSIKILTGALAAGMLLSSAIPYNVLAESTSKIEGIADAKSVLSGLTKEQRAALKTLDARPEFTISPDVNTTTPDKVNIIVEFKQAPAKIEILKQTAKGKKMTLSAAEKK